MLIWPEIKIILIIAIMLLIPGWAFLAVSGLWQRYKGLQSWFLAIGISIAFYPLLFYSARTILPNLRIGETKLTVLLILMLGLIAWFMRKSWREPFKIGKWGGLLLAILGATLFTRFILAHQYPYPAWTDSLHHTLITDLVYKTGQLPYDLQPYAPTSLDQYHLGLYSLTGSLQLLANIPAHTALLWMSQALNGLCVIGLFLFLDRKVSRLAALVGMVAVGLFNFQPAWYFNWGRFTQVASQSILLIAGVITWDAVVSWSKDWPNKKKDVLLLSLASSILIAGVFLLHFKVAGYALPLLAMICLYELVRNIKNKRKARQRLLGISAIVLVSILLILPILIPAANVYIQQRTTPPVIQENLENTIQNSNPYYTTYNFTSLWHLALEKWLAVLAVGGVLIGVYHKKTRPVTILILTWITFLFLEGFAYLLDIPLLAFTNMTGMMIMLYLPMGILIGILVNGIMTFLKPYTKVKIQPILIWVLLFSGFIASFDRVNGVEDYRQFMTDADRNAMAWIKESTPGDAVFAINTHFWLPNAAHGSDGGYWIPYFTDRETTANMMIANLGPGYDVVMEQSNAVLALYEGEPSLGNLCAMGVDYIYDGAKTPFDGQSFDIEQIKNQPGVNLMYNTNGVTILKICD
ncbi:MAG: hypothetical protein P1P73_07285 [Brevefilum sp.]|nr:hypothetical protein [Brevefilum sp.]